MDTQTSTEPVHDNPVVTPALQTTDESRLTPELVERVGKLAPAEQDRLGILIAGGLGEQFQETPEDRQWWREEIARRVESIKNGTAEFSTLEETLAELDAVIAETEQQ